MKKLKIYLDTSVISHLQADDVPGKMVKTLEFWEYIERGEYSVFISDLVVAEIEECPFCIGLHSNCIIEEESD